MRDQTTGRPQTTNEAEATIEAIHEGKVDALVVNGPEGPQIVMLQNADQPYRVLVERMSDGALTAGPDGLILYANRRLADLTGELAESLIGRKFSTLFDDAEMVGSENVSVPARLRARGSTIPVSVWLSSIFMGGVSAQLVTITDLSAQHKFQEIVSAERFARSILEQSTEAIVVLGHDGRISHASLVAEEMAAQAPVGRMFTQAFHVEKASLPIGKLDAMLAVKPFHGVEIELAHPRHGPGSFLLSAGPLLDEAKHPIGAVVTLTNITARKRAEEQQTILVAELNHRVKNILAVVQAVSSQTMRTSPSLQTFSATFSGRIRALAMAHDILTRTRWRGIGLAELLESVLSPYQGPGQDRVRISGPPVLLPARTVVPLSMVLHELATNASKYGALSSQLGRVDVDWSVGHNGTPAVAMNWTEVHGPKIPAAVAAGFGTTLIRRVIGQDLEGSVELDFERDGLRSLIKFPIRTHGELNDLRGGAHP